MTHFSDDKLDQLLREAFPVQEVSSDFTLELWHGLMKKSGRFSTYLPAPLLAAAAVMGIVLGVWSWGQIIPGLGAAGSSLTQSARLDLFGNAPLDTLAGSYLKVRGDG